MERLGSVTTERLNGLLDAVVALSSDLSLDNLLERIVRQACQLVGARYGALGVLDTRSGHRLTRFVTHGFSDREIKSVGEPPSGHGILGLIIEDPKPLRLTDLGAHPDAFGFPAHHPPMQTFLGVPIRIHGRVFGNLYLTEKQSPGGFTIEDEVVAVALASAVGVVIENARLYEEAERQRMWLEAAADITAALLGPVSRESALQLVVDRARQAASADVVALLMPADDDKLEVLAVSGGQGSMVGERLDLHATLSGEVARTQVAAVVPDTNLDDRYQRDAAASWPRLGSVVILPLRSGDLTGTLTVGWCAVLTADNWELDPILAQRFAEQAALVMRVAQAQEDQARLAVFEDRDRIGRDLHDVVIQRMFAVGLMLENTIKLTSSPDAAAELSAAIDEIDATIMDIRRTIFALGPQPDASDLRAVLGRLFGHAAVMLGFSPDFESRGPLDSGVPDEVREHLLAVLGEALSNVGRHAGASRVQVLIDVSNGVYLRVRDDGRGLDADVIESGLKNMRFRAKLLGGRCEVHNLRGGGVEIRWRVPAVAA
jgi:signal transduction histidine kinase